MKDSRTNIKENLVDTGFGYSQILPILLSVWKVNMSENSSVRRFLYGYIGGQSADYYEAIEQPELHLHPALQAKLIDVFSQLASEENGGKIKFVLETHSEAMINRLGYLINKKNCYQRWLMLLFLIKMIQETRRYLRQNLMKKGNWKNGRLVSLIR